MVSVSDPSAAILADVHRHLVLLVDGVRGSGTFEESFLAWSLGDVADLALREMVDAAMLRLRGPARSHRDVATLSMIALTGAGRLVELEVLREAIEWLAGRGPRVAGQPAPFVADVEALFAIAQGASKCGGRTRETVRDWLAGFAPDVLGRTQLMEGWQRELLRAACRTVGLEVSGGTLSGPTVADVAMFVAFRAQSSGGDDIVIDGAEVMTLCRVSVVEPPPPILAIIRLWVLQRLLASSGLDVSRPTVEMVVTLLQGVRNSCLKWTWESKPRTSRKGAVARRWHIENEYHVQTLLWVVLRPVFPDLDDEFYVEPTGPYQPRVDFRIPSLRLLIEVKYRYHYTRMSKVIEQVGADASTYLKDGAYDGIVAFVWDEAGRHEQEDELKRGLESLPGVLAAVVVSKPSFMVPTAPPPAAPSPTSDPKPSPS